jgi:hypothetical protein
VKNCFSPRFAIFLALSIPITGSAARSTLRGFAPVIELASWLGSTIRAPPGADDPLPESGAVIWPTTEKGLPLNAKNSAGITLSESIPWEGTIRSYILASKVLNKQVE